MQECYCLHEFKDHFRLGQLRCIHFDCNCKGYRIFEEALKDGLVTLVTERGSFDQVVQAFSKKKSSTPSVTYDPFKIYLNYPPPTPEEQEAYLKGIEDGNFFY